MKCSGYGVLYCKTYNIGDDIQGVAASQLLPEVNYYVTRDNMNIVYDAKTMNIIPEDDLKKLKIAIILNGWFMHTCNSNFLGEQPHEDIVFPPPDHIIPLCISMHLTPILLKNNKRFDDKFKQFFKSHEPIGCRDVYTYDQLKQRDIDAYVSGCLTLTLTNTSLNTSTTILNDTPIITPINALINIDIATDKNNETICATDRPINSMIHVVHNKTYVNNKSIINLNPMERINAAQKLLLRYMQANYVVTDRLHCYLPCKAFGTNVKFIGNERDERMVGLLNGNHEEFKLVLKSKVNEWLNSLEKVNE